MGLWDAAMKSQAAHMAVYYEPAVYVPMIIMAIAAVLGAVLLIVSAKWRDCNADADPAPCEKVKANTKWAGVSFFGLFVLAMIAATVAIKWKALVATKAALSSGDLAGAFGASGHVL